jgi:hypothetical protein
MERRSLIRRRSNWHFKNRDFQRKAAPENESRSQRRTAQFRPRKRPRIFSRAARMCRRTSIIRRASICRGYRHPAAPILARSWGSSCASRQRNRAHQRPRAGAAARKDFALRKLLYHPGVRPLRRPSNGCLIRSPGTPKATQIRNICTRQLASSVLCQRRSPKVSQQPAADCTQAPAWCRSIRRKSAARSVEPPDRQLTRMAAK